MFSICDVINNEIPKSLPLELIFFLVLKKSSILFSYKRFILKLLYKLEWNKLINKDPFLHTSANLSLISIFWKCIGTEKNISCSMRLSSFVTVRLLLGSNSETRNFSFSSLINIVPCQRMYSIFNLHIFNPADFLLLGYLSIIFLLTVF